MSQPINPLAAARQVLEAHTRLEQCRELIPNSNSPKCGHEAYVDAKTNWQAIIDSYAVVLAEALLARQETIHAKFHQCWSACVGTPDYDKSVWLEAEKQMLRAGCFKDVNGIRASNDTPSGDYVSPPLEHVGTVKVTYRDVGELKPLPYPLEEPVTKQMMQQRPNTQEEMVMAGLAPPTEKPVVQPALTDPIRYLRDLNDELVEHEIISPKACVGMRDKIEQAASELSSLRARIAALEQQLAGGPEVESDPTIEGRRCECHGCGSMAYVGIHVTNGRLFLCKLCRSDINRKNPLYLEAKSQVAALSAALRDAASKCPECNGKRKSKKSIWVPDPNKPEVERLAGMEECDCPTCAPWRRALEGPK